MDNRTLPIRLSGLNSSPDATQVELEGGHDLDQDDPTGVSTEILELVDAR